MTPSPLFVHVLRGETLLLRTYAFLKKKLPSEDGPEQTNFLNITFSVILSYGFSTCVMHAQLSCYGCNYTSLKSFKMQTFPLPLFTFLTNAIYASFNTGDLYKRHGIASSTTHNFAINGQFYLNFSGVKTFCLCFE